MGITHRTAEGFWSEDIWLQDMSQLFPKAWLQGFFGARPTLVLKHGWLTETALVQGLCNRGCVVLCSHRQNHFKTGCLQQAETIFGSGSILQKEANEEGAFVHQRGLKIGIVGPRCSQA